MDIIKEELSIIEQRNKIVYDYLSSGKLYDWLEEELKNEDSNDEYLYKYEVKSCRRCLKYSYYMNFLQFNDIATGKPSKNSYNNKIVDTISSIPIDMWKRYYGNYNTFLTISKNGVNISQ